MKVKLGSSTLKTHEEPILLWLIKKSTGYYAKDSQTGKRESLRTKSRAEAQRILAAKNETLHNCPLNLQLGKIYLAGHDPKLICRTWAEVMVELVSHGKEQTQNRCRRGLNSKAFDLIRGKKVVETTGDDLRAILQAGGAATNNYLHRLHNLALALGSSRIPEGIERNAHASRSTQAAANIKPLTPVPLKVEDRLARSPMPTPRKHIRERA